MHCRAEGLRLNVAGSDVQERVDLDLLYLLLLLGRLTLHVHFAQMIVIDSLRLPFRIGSLKEAELS